MIENSLFIGANNISIEGQFLKHPALISKYTPLRTNKLKENMGSYIGLDLETVAETGELKLLGIYDYDINQYRPYLNNFIGVFFSVIKQAYFEKKTLVWWSKLDPFIIFKQFLLNVKKDTALISLNKWGKIFGNYNQKKAQWEKDAPPVISVSISNYEFGILSSIRGSVQFYFINENNPEYIHKVWAYDIAGLYKSTLTKEGKRFDYYSKMSEEYHIINWDRFDTDLIYKNNVLKSNELDAHVVCDLAIKLNNDFYKMFNFYPKSLISTGAVARSGIIGASMINYPIDYKEKIANIPLLSHLDRYHRQLGENDFIECLSSINESYSGGDIETFSYGYVKDAYYSDIASAYPSVIVNLWDLTDSVATSGEGTPPHIENSYCFIRGEVTIPLNTYHHPLTVKHPTIKDLNIRPNGTFIASYTLPERDYLITLGASFKNEKWFNIETKSIKSPLATATQYFLDKRTELKKIGDSAEYTAKIIANSIYGITYEATDLYNFNGKDTTRAGYRGGEFYNPIYASYITALTRIKIARVVNAIKEKGGTPILAMTDSVFWKGTPEMIPAELVTPTKTLGFFEGVTHIKDFYCLGAGRYSYIEKGQEMKEQTTYKTRGLAIKKLIDPEGVILDFNWLDAIKNNVDTRIKVKVNVLISVGLINHSKSHTIKDLGLVATEVREVDLLVGTTKRFLEDIKDARTLASNLYETSPLIIPYSDLSHKILRDKMKNLTYINREQKAKNNVKRATRKYYNKNKNDIKDMALTKYQQAKNKGYDSVDARALSKLGENKFNAIVNNPFKKSNNRFIIKV